MLTKITTAILTNIKFSQQHQFRHYRICIVGGVGGVGHKLALLLKLNKLVTQVTIYDIKKSTAGLALDLSYIPTATKVAVYNEINIFNISFDI